MAERQEGTTIDHPLKNSITISYRILIPATAEQVWEFTQDYNKRKDWDAGIVFARVIQENPRKLVEIKMKGNTKTTFKYKLENKPHRSSLAMINTRSLFFIGGGGSWSYEFNGSQTNWQQTNTLILKPFFAFSPIKYIIRTYLRRNMILSMENAKRQIEFLLAKGNYFS